MHPAIALQVEIFSALIASSNLTTALGGTFIYDDVPNGQKPPYVVFGTAVYSNWSTSTEDGTEHSISLNIWSTENGKKQVLEISQHIVEALDALPKTVSGHHLINMTNESLEVSRNVESGYFHGTQNYRAITEPV